jgi:hypothetical protein
MQYITVPRYLYTYECNDCVNLLSSWQDLPPFFSDLQGWVAILQLNKQWIIRIILYILHIYAHVLLYCKRRYIYFSYELINTTNFCPLTCSKNKSLQPEYKSLTSYHASLALNSNNQPRPEQIPAGFIAPKTLTLNYLAF